MAKTKKYYSLKELYGVDAQYNILFGERSNGKSYSVREMILYTAYHEKDFFTRKKVSDYQFGYVRRWDLELKGESIERYFDVFVQDADGNRRIYDMTGGEYSCISCYRKSIYFANVDEETGKVIRGKLIGKAFALTADTHYKSLDFPLVGRLVFEEFITDAGYLANEPKKLMSLVSTIFRRRPGKIFMIGNTLSRDCPYFGEWFDHSILKMKQGEIRVYDRKEEETTVRIAVEYCESNTEKSNAMFFGASAKMINSGTWDSEDQPHLENDLDTYVTKFIMFVEHAGLCYMLRILYDRDDNNTFLYVSPHTTEIRNREKTRVITDKFSLSPYHSDRLLTDIFYCDTIILDLIRRGKVVFSDNLTGTEFKRLSL